MALHSIKMILTQLFRLHKVQRVLRLIKQAIRVSDLNRCLQIRILSKLIVGALPLPLTRATTSITLLRNFTFI